MPKPKSRAEHALQIFLRRADEESLADQPINLLTLGRQLKLSEAGIVAGVYALVENQARAQRLKISSVLVVAAALSFFFSYRLGGRSPAVEATAQPQQIQKAQQLQKPQKKAVEQTAPSQLPPECASLSDREKGKCLLRVASARKDIRLCQLTTGDESHGVLCVRGVAPLIANDRPCPQLSDAPKLQDLCFRTLATHQRSPEPCLGVIDEFQRGACLLQISQLTGDRSVCKRMEGLGQYEKCWRNFAEQATELSSCEDFPAGKLRERCQMTVAQDSDAPLDACQRLTDADLRNSCFFKLSERSNRPSEIVPACFKTRAKDPCLLHAAHRLGVPSLCERMSDVAGGECLVWLAIRGRAPALCNKIKPQGVRDSCYVQLAGVMKEQRLCRKIKIKAAREQCLDKF